MRLSMRIPSWWYIVVAAVILVFLSFAALGRIAKNGFSFEPPAGGATYEPVTRSLAESQSAPVPMVAQKTTADSHALNTHVVGRVVSTGNVAPPPLRPNFRGPSQLIRTGSINIQVSDIEKAIRAANGIVDAELGDVISLDDQSGGPQPVSQTASMQIRVPQYRFDATLDDLARLGKVTSRSISAQDVADQITDAQARLRNLRHTEADILKIMDRYGDIEQVLRVTQELSDVRQQIETLDAQVKGMQYQVAYSTISINFMTPAAVAQPPSGLAVLSKAWQAAVASLKALTLSLLTVLLWIVAFSPYLIMGAVLAMLAMRRMRVRPASPH